ncbi:uncharacterized protein B0P05DRAFT_529348 [Gilbertella persicaria]|uniref:uncharacterized protein n=1 Tax=Gilbertella persicaria TaxID=101096 RepID=UPI00221EC6FE|nr:uncharacterized protein B0P05DRAFT_529348 [Gilbertella persicaria]KAI8090105.1 hypothetical protein B0P05DRAFT_529348 [Gilbertella persicaria]
MSKPLATAFQSLNKKLAYETRVYTLGLYRSLLRSSEQYRQNSIKQEVREKFKKNKHNTSRSQVLCLLQEADKTLDYLNRGIAGEKDVRAKINEYVQKYNVSLVRHKGMIYTQFFSF